MLRQKIDFTFILYLFFTVSLTACGGGGGGGGGSDSSDNGSNASADVLADRDGDGVVDLVEVFFGTATDNPSDTPQEIIFIAEDGGGITPTSAKISYTFQPDPVDVYFGMDATGSMTGEMSALATNVFTIDENASCQLTASACSSNTECAGGQVCNGDNVCMEDPGIDGCIENLFIGGGTWDELDSFQNRVSSQDWPQGAVAVSNFLQGLALSPSGGFAEAVYQAAACVADGDNCSNTDKNCATTGVGCPGFRSEALKIYIQITDANDQCSGIECSSFTAATAGSALNSAGITFASLVGFADGDAETDARAIGLNAGSVDSVGEPFVYPAVDAAVADQAANAIAEINATSSRSFAIEAQDDPADSGGSAFIASIEVDQVSTNCDNTLATSDSDGDFIADTFLAGQPYRNLCWAINAVATNTVISANAALQVYPADLLIQEDGVTVDTVRVYFFVPPA